MVTEKRKIKFHLIVFIVFLMGHITVLLIMSESNSDHFYKSVFSYSKKNINVIDTLTIVGTNLYIHKQSIQRYLVSADTKWSEHQNAAKNRINDHFAWLEKTNQEIFKNWVSVPDFNTTNARAELSELLEMFEKGEAGQDHLQRLFYLVRINTQLLFKNNNELIQNLEAHSLTPEMAQWMADQTVYTEIINAGTNQLMKLYNEFFWDHTINQNSLYHKTTNLYHQLLIIASIMLLGYGLIIMFRIFRYFYRQNKTDHGETLVLVGSQDMATGTFNRKSFELFTSQELSRSQRRDYNLSLVMIKVLPYTAIKDSQGDPVVNTLLSEISHTLIRYSKNYDRVYRYDKDIFAISLINANPKQIKKTILHIKKRLKKNKYIAKNKLSKDLIRIGHALYPLNAKSLQGLVKYALRDLNPEPDKKSERTEKPNTTPNIVDEMTHPAPTANTETNQLASS